MNAIHGSMAGFTAFLGQELRPCQSTEMCRMVVTLPNFALAMPVNGRSCSIAPLWAILDQSLMVVDVAIITVAGYATCQGVQSGMLPYI